MNINIGDVVKLKSGSLPMTVAKPDDRGGAVWVCWYEPASGNTLGEIKMLSLPLSVLEKEA